MVGIRSWEVRRSAVEGVFSAAVGLIFRLYNLLPSAHMSSSKKKLLHPKQELCHNKAPRKQNPGVSTFWGNMLSKQLRKLFFAIAW